MDLAQKFSDFFWSPSVWLPPNVTWEELRPNDKVRYTESKDLYLPLPMAFVMLFIRFLLERYCYSPFGVYLGIKSSKPKKAPFNEILEKAYKQNNKMKYKEVLNHAKQLEMSERQIERWLRLRRTQEKPSTLTKFCENSWRCTYYAYSFFYGLYFLWDKPWLWNIDECWTNYPHQSITEDMRWYYLVSLSFYWSLTVSQFTDVKRKDFWQMFVHHIATICLMSFSWVCNLTRVGTLVLVVHDCADIFLEAAKMAKYAKYQKVCDAFLGIFTILWIVTRIGIFPFWIIYSTAIRAPRIVDTFFPAYYIFNGLLILLLILHIFWTHLILKVVYNSLSAGQMERDIRSSSSSEEVSDASNHSNNSVKPKAQ